MPLDRRIRLIAIVVIAMGGMLLASPKNAQAAPTSDCGVCGNFFYCPTQVVRAELCVEFCYDNLAGSCQFSPPDGWECPAGYEAVFWTCGP